MGKLNGDNNWSNNQIGRAIRMENLILLRLAYTLGNTSPKSNMRKVTKTTSTTNFTTGETIPAKKELDKNEKIMTIPILTKLLAKSKVASSFLGFCNNWATN